MARLPFRRIEFAVPNARARAHALHIAALHDGARAKAVTMFEATRQNVSENLHVTMPVHAEAGIRRHSVVVDHAQNTKTHVLRVVIIAERKSVAAIEPIETRHAALVAASNGNH